MIRMATETYRVPYGQTEWEFALPAGMTGTVVQSNPLPPLADFPAAIRAALEEPVASPPLRELARPGDRVCLVFTDVTRASPDHLLVPPLLEELARAGVRDEDVTLLCGLGMHRPTTPEEKIAKLGRAVVERYRVVDHEPRNPAALVDLGTTETGIPLTVNRLAYEADLVIATGIVEPHQYAGYSGGRKTLAVGAAGEAMIAHTHGPAFVDHPGTRLGRLEGNPFHEALMEAARRAGLRFILNVVLAPPGEGGDEGGHLAPVAVRAGAPHEAFLELVQVARSLSEVPIPRQFDAAIGGVGFPKDANLYQASRAASYLYFAPTPVVRPGGLLIIPARCQEGAGEGTGEQRFLATMRDTPSVQALIDHARRYGYQPGEQRAFVMAKLLAECEVVIVGAECPEVVRQAKMTPLSDMAAALTYLADRCGRNADVLIVPHALLTLPVVHGARELTEDSVPDEG